VQGSSSAWPHKCKRAACHLTCEQQTPSIQQCPDGVHVVVMVSRSKTSEPCDPSRHQALHAWSLQSDAKATAVTHMLGMLVTCLVCPRGQVSRPYSTKCAGAQHGPRAAGFGPFHCLQMEAKAHSLNSKQRMR